MKRKLHLNTLILSTSLLLLVACGGGGGDSSDTNTNPTDQTPTTPTPDTGTNPTPDTGTGTDPGNFEPTNLKILGTYSFRTTNDVYFRCNHLKADEVVVAIPKIETTMRVFIRKQFRSLARPDQLITAVGLVDPTPPTVQWERYRFTLPVNYGRKDEDDINLAAPFGQTYVQGATGYGPAHFELKPGTYNETTTQDNMPLLLDHLMLPNFFEGGWGGTIRIGITDASTTGQSQRKCEVVQAFPSFSGLYNFLVDFDGEKL